MADYYAYVHARPESEDASGIFYVGKGKGKRAYDFNRRAQNPHYARIVAKNGSPVVGIIDCSSESIAFDLECGLIKCLRRMKVPLSNLSNGGEGQSGYRHTDETKIKIGRASAAWTRTASLKLKIALSQLGDKNNAKSIEARIKISEKRRGSIWMNNGINERLAPLAEMEQLDPAVWTTGRLPSSVAGASVAATGNTNTRGTVWINKLGEFRRVQHTNLFDFIADGWLKGRTK